MSWEALALPEDLLRAVAALGFDEPTPIQRQALPLIRTGRDLLGEAQTGSGKTAAYVLPLLVGLRTAHPDTAFSPVRALVMTPTRELALQVAKVFKDLDRFAPRPARILAVIGGESIDAQIAALAKGVEVVVATPGRVLDLVERGALSLACVQTLVLDEGDKLLDAGFEEELNHLVLRLPDDRQTLLFSATLPSRVTDVAGRVLRAPLSLRIDSTTRAPEGIAQRAIPVDRDRRRLLLQHLVRTEALGQTMVFVATQRASENLAAKLRVAGISSGCLHGSLDQAERNGVLQRFRHRGFQILVCTDIASRGIDIEGLDTVVNFDLPRAPRDYLHRIGRTGRAGAVGSAISFVDPASEAHLALIETRCDVALGRHPVVGFEPTDVPPLPTKGSPPVKGKRKSKKDKAREQAARA